MAINSVTAAPAVQQAMRSNTTGTSGAQDHDGDNDKSSTTAASTTQAAKPSSAVPPRATFAVHA